MALVEKQSIIKGDGFNHSGGGFAELIIDGQRFDVDDVARRVACHDEMLKALEGVVAALSGRVHSHAALSSLARAEVAIENARR